MVGVLPHIEIHPQKTLIHLYTLSQSASASSYSGLLAVIWVRDACIFSFSSSTCSFKVIVVVYRSIFTTGDSRRLQKLDVEQYSTVCHFGTTISKAHTSNRSKEREKDLGTLLQHISKKNVQDGETVALFFCIIPLYVSAAESGLAKEVDKMLEGSTVCKWQKSLGTHSISHLKAVTAVLNTLVRNICHRSLLNLWIISTSLK